MKNKYILISAACLILALSAVFGFTNKPASGGILTMRTVETACMTCDHSITIAYENGKFERIELQKLQSKDFSLNLLVINETLNRLRSSGYRLLSTAESGESGTIITTYSFEKE